MKYKNSILICELEENSKKQYNIYVNGVAVGEIDSFFKELTPPDKIANYSLTYTDIIDILDKVKSVIHADS